MKKKIILNRLVGKNSDGNFNYLKEYIRWKFPGNENFQNFETQEFIHFSDSIQTTFSKYTDRPINILEIGCGNNAFPCLLAYAIAETLGVKINYLGLDINEGDINFLSEQMKSLENVKFSATNIGDEKAVLKIAHETIGDAKKFDLLLMSWPIVENPLDMAGITEHKNTDKFKILSEAFNAYQNFFLQIMKNIMQDEAEILSVFAYPQELSSALYLFDKSHITPIAVCDDLQLLKSKYMDKPLEKIQYITPQFDFPVTSKKNNYDFTCEIKTSWRPNFIKSSIFKKIIHQQKTPTARQEEEKEVRKKNLCPSSCTIL